MLETEILHIVPGLLACSTQLDVARRILDLEGAQPPSMMESISRLRPQRPPAASSVARYRSHIHGGSAQQQRTLEDAAGACLLRYSGVSVPIRTDPPVLCHCLDAGEQAPIVLACASIVSNCRQAAAAAALPARIATKDSMGNDADDAAARDLGQHGRHAVRLDPAQSAQVHCLQSR